MQNLQHIQNMERKVAQSLTGSSTKRLKCSRLSETLYLNEGLADVHFIFNSAVGGPKKVPAHKNIMANGSPAFKAMFYGDLKEESDVTIVDASHVGFERFLQFFYLSEVLLSIDYITEVITLLDKYVVPDCMEICDDYLKQTLSADNIGFGVELAINFSNENLQTICSKEIYKDPAKVFASDLFLECSVDALEFILGLDQLNCKEYCVFAACMEWAKFICTKNEIDAESMENRRIQLGESFNLIQFGVMDPEEIFNCVVGNSQLFARDELEELFAIADPRTVFTDLKIFKHTTRDNVNYKWNKNKTIRVQRSNEDGSEYYLQPSEVIIFRSNSRMLFGGVSMKRLWRYNYAGTTEYTFVGKMEIVEKSPLPDVADVILLRSTTIKIKTSKNGGNHNYIEFGPVVIKPNRLYKIHLRFNFAADEGFRTSGSNRNCIFVGGRNFQIIFDHQESDCDGLISDFFFNHI